MNSSSGQPSFGAGATDRRAELESVVDRILQVVPRTMGRIRTEMRNAGTGTLTVPQLRALLFIRRRPGGGLSPLAEHLGMALPSASALVERLVRADLVERVADPDERRRIQLRLTARGEEHLSRAHLLVRSRLSADLAALPATELTRLAAALDVLAALSRDESSQRP
jgi:DNA-binding MarR family transcriptional regulator